MPSTVVAAAVVAVAVILAAAAILAVAGMGWAAGRTTARRMHSRPRITGLRSVITVATGQRTTTGARVGSWVTQAQATPLATVTCMTSTSGTLATGTACFGRRCSLTRATSGTYRCRRSYTPCLAAATYP